MFEGLLVHVKSHQTEKTGHTIFSNKKEVMQLDHYETALVTGASAGIGRAIARDLAAAGLRVAFCARREERLEALAAEIREAGGTALPIVCDLRDERAISEMFETIDEEFGNLDVVVNNAGLGRNTPLVGGDPEVWRMTWEVNVHALLVCTSLAVERMEARGFAGHVVHISSMSAHRVPEGSGIYSATKFAVRSLTEGLRQELRARDSRVRVSSISPGFVRTEFAENYSGSAERAEQVYDEVDAIDPAEIARAVRFVLSAPPNTEYNDLLIRPTRQKS
jgi:NADP-dependent 3-hydroxy acid dehydrogenase YdfG